MLPNQNPWNDLSPTTELWLLCILFSFEFLMTIRFCGCERQNQLSHNNNNNNNGKFIRISFYKWPVSNYPYWVSPTANYSFFKKINVLLFTKRHQTPSEYLRLYERRRAASNYPFSKFHGYAYDAVWAVAMAIDDVIRQHDGRYDVTDFHDTRFHAALNRTDFVGVTVCKTLL